VKAEPEQPDRITELPVLVLFPHNRCNCRCMMCDIWRIGQTRQIRISDLEPHLDSIRRLKVQWVVFSGGEPQLNRDFGKMAALLRAEGLRLTLLTAGLLLEANAESIAGLVDDIIVSIDGPAEIHDRIRGIPGAFQRLARGISAVRQQRAGIEISVRTTVQKGNHHALCRTADAARGIGAASISLLAADITSSAFNRAEPWEGARQRQIALSEDEIGVLEREIEALIRSPGMAAGFIREDEFKLRRIVRHFRAHLGLQQAEAPRCNAPWVSAVIEADGNVRPCFFHPPIGNIHDRPLIDVVNGRQAIAFREQLDIASNPVCRRCVCSLNWS
jgi:MoaA/NifB/PqqE/SkfB family radical SAM enzyme